MFGQGAMNFPNSFLPLFRSGTGGRTPLRGGESQHFAGVIGVADPAGQIEPCTEPGEEAGRSAVAPVASPAAADHDRSGGTAAQPVGRADQDHRPVIGGAARQAEPGGERRPASHRRQSEIEGHQRETGVEQELRGGQRIAEILRPQPQQSFRSTPISAADWGSSCAPWSTRAAASPAPVTARSAAMMAAKRPQDPRPMNSTSPPRCSPPPSSRSKAIIEVGRGASRISMRRLRTSSEARKREWRSSSDSSVCSVAADCWGGCELWNFHRIFSIGINEA